MRPAAVNRQLGAGPHWVNLPLCHRFGPNTAERGGGPLFTRIEIQSDDKSFRFLVIRHDSSPTKARWMPSLSPAASQGVMIRRLIDAEPEFPAVRTANYESSSMQAISDVAESLHP